MTESMRSRTTTWSDPRLTADISRGMAGLELLRGLRDGTIPSLPMGHLIGISFTEVEEGAGLPCA